MQVLLVDDSQVTLTLYKNAVRDMEDVQCISFTSSADALKWAISMHPLLIVVDYRMPPPNGIEFIEAFRASQANEATFIVMVTVNSDRDVRLRALAAGANDFMTKPVDQLEFVMRVRNMLALGKSRRQLADHAAWLTDEVRTATASIRAREIETIVRLTRAAEFRDDVTGCHIIRVGHIAQTIARELGLPEDVSDTLLLAAPMHDIGKVAISDEILLKRGPLSSEEVEIMKRHTTAGYDILKGSDSQLLRHAADIALSHHERFDGKGYPSGLSGNEIPLSGRICSLADVFDALTSTRPYKEAWDTDTAAAYINERSGREFDPMVVDAFNGCFEKIREIKSRFSDDAAAALVG